MLSGGVIQHSVQQPRGAQGTLDTAAWNIGPAIGIPLEGVNLFQRAGVIQCIPDGNLIPGQRLQVGVRDAAVSCQKFPKTRLPAQHELGVFFYQVTLDQKAEEFLRGEKGNLAATDVVHVFLFCIAVSISYEQGRPGGKNQVEHLQMILLCHKLTPIKIGLE